MSAIGLAFLAFLVALSGAGLGLAFRDRLPAHHLSRDSTDVIKLATGLMATLVALVLSLLISSANSFRLEVEGEYRRALANVGELDQRLRAYGPQTGEIRGLLRQTVAEAAHRRWPDEQFGPAPAGAPDTKDALIDLERRIVRLRPADDEQKWFQAQALQLVNSLVQIQQLMSDQARSSSQPIPVLLAVAFCAAVIFANFGLFAQPNPTMIGALAVAALAVAGSVFLILELGTPFSGLLQITSAPVKTLLEALGR